MKQKISVSISRDVLEELEKVSGSGQSRSAYIERVLRQHFRRRARAAIDARDGLRIDNAADRLNEEADEVLEDQAGWQHEPG